MGQIKERELNEKNSVSLWAMGFPTSNSPMVKWTIVIHASKFRNEHMLSFAQVSFNGVLREARSQLPPSVVSRNRR